MEFRFPNKRETMEGPFAQLSAAVAEKGIPLRLVPGAEVHVAADLVSRLREGDLMTYNDNRRYMLLEFPFQQIVSGTEEVVYRLRLAGVTPVIAHPERIEFFMEGLGRLESLVKLGALAQVTGGSLLGSFGEKSERASWKMVERKLVHVVASDGHDQKHRRPVLREATDLLAARAGPETARQMSQDVPEAIVDGRDIDAPEPVPKARGLKGLLGSIFSRG
jgi:protein-tyrosine phosphatase